VIFNTDQDEYIGDLTEGAGIRVIVHNQTDMPFPEDQSIAVSPGTLTYIGASLVREKTCSAESRKLINYVGLVPTYYATAHLYRQHLLNIESQLYESPFLHGLANRCAWCAWADDS